MKNPLLFLALILLCIGGAYGACKPGRVCPSVFDPICAKRVIKGRTEFRTFGNMCTFNNCPEGFKFVKKGKC